MSASDTYKSALKKERYYVDNAIGWANSALASSQTHSTHFDNLAAGAWTDAMAQAQIVKSLQESYPSLSPSCVESPEPGTNCEPDTNLLLLAEGFPDSAQLSKALNVYNRLYYYQKFHDLSNQQAADKKSGSYAGQFGGALPNFPAPDGSLGGQLGGALPGLPAPSGESSVPIWAWLAGGAAIVYGLVKVFR